MAIQLKTDTNRCSFMSLVFSFFFLSVFLDAAFCLHSHKMAYPFAGFVVVLIAAPIAIRFGRVGFFAGLVIAFFLNFIYWEIGRASCRERV